MLIKETHQLDSSIVEYEQHETASICKIIKKRSDWFAT